MTTESTVQQDVTKVETAVKADVAKVQADESKLSRTQLAWAAGVVGLLVGFLIKLFL